MVWPVSMCVNYGWCDLSVCVLVKSGVCIKSGVFIKSGVACQYAC